MEFIVFNLDAPFRKEELGGRLYYVVPVTMIVQGVLNGSEGPLFYPQDQIAAHPDSWNGMPIVTPHPTEIDPDGNEVPVTARRPDILQKFGIGWVYHSNVEGDEAPLKAEAWFDVENTKRVDKRILAALEKGEPLEVSTGLYTLNQPAPAGSTYNGVEYKFIATNFRPDHLAVLPDDTGACSNDDGCGIFVGNQEDFDSIPLETKGELLDILSTLAPLGYEVVIASPQNRQPRSKNTGRFKPIGAGTGKGVVHESAQAGFLVIQDSDNKYGKIASQEIQNGSSVPSWVEDETKWNKAIKSSTLARRAGDYAFISAVYRKLGGRFKSVENQDTPPTKGKEKMAQKTKSKTAPEFNREQAKKYLTANCSCLQGKNAQVLDKMDNAALKTLMNNAKMARAYVIVRNKAKKSLEENEDNEGEAAGVDIAGLADFLGITTDPKSDPVTFINDLKIKLQDVLGKIGGEEKKPDPEPDPAVMEDAEDDEDDDQDIKKNQDDEDFVDDTNPKQNRRQSRLTPEEQEDLAFARQVKNQQKKNIVIRLTANMQDPKRRRMKAKQLMNKGLTELQEMVELLPPVRQAFEDEDDDEFDFTQNQDFRLPPARQGKKRPSYAGAGGGPIGNWDTGGDDCDDAVLMPPSSTNGTSKREE